MICQITGKNGLGEFLGDIDKDGPADLAGLRKGDRIIEVNGNNIEQDTHPQVNVRLFKNFISPSSVTCQVQTGNSKVLVVSILDSCMVGAVSKGF